MFRNRYLTTLLVVSLVFLLGSFALAQEGKYDLNGKTIKIQICWSSDTPMSSIGETGDYNWYDQAPRLEQHVQEVEEMFNCNIEFVHQGWVDDAIEVLREGVLAGDEPFDYMLTDGPGMISMARDYLIMPLDNVLEEDFYEGYPPMFRRERYSSKHTFGGKIYGFEGLNSRGEQHTIIWNKTFFEENDLPNLAELYQEGEWTWEAFRDIARKATMDTNDDGENDRIGVGLYHGNQNLTFFAVTNGNTLEYTDNGFMKVDMTDPAIVEAYEFMQGMFDEGIIEMWGDRNSHAMGMTSADILPYYDANIDGEWGVVPLPKGPRAEEHVIIGHGEWNGVIPIYVKEPRKVIEVVQALFRLSKPYIDEDFETWEENYWYNDPGFANIVPDRETLEIWKELFEKKELNPPFSVRRAIQRADYSGVSSAVRQGGSVGAALSEMQSAVQEELNIVLDQ